MQILVIKRRSRKAEILGRSLQAYTHLLYLQASSITQSLQLANKGMEKLQNLILIFGRFALGSLGSNFARS